MFVTCHAVVNRLNTFEFTAMPSIPVDVLREILEHVDKNDLPALCRVNKVCCSYSRDVLYRNIYHSDKRVTLTLARSTVLARRVRSFEYCYSYPELATALRNMSSLRSLDLGSIGDDASILDGCTFKLDSFAYSFPYDKSLQKILNSQPNLTDVTVCKDHKPLIPFDEMCLPKLTRVMATPSWLRILIPGRPVREALVLLRSGVDFTDWSFFTFSTTPIQKLSINYDVLYPRPVSLLVSIFSSLVHLMVQSYGVEWAVRVSLCSSI